MPININNQTKHKLPNKTSLKRWLTQSAKSENKKISNIEIVVCTDEFLLNLNLKYLNHNTYTDIITFDYGEEQLENTIAGDIFISADRIKALNETLSLNKKKLDEIYDAPTGLVDR